jgi:hypothetical protein
VIVTIFWKVTLMIEGPKDMPPPDSPPVAYFHFFFTDLILILMVTESNRYVQQVHVVCVCWEAHKPISCTRPHWMVPTVVRYTWCDNLIPGMAPWKQNLLTCALAAAVAFEILSLWSCALHETMVPLPQTVLKIVPEYLAVTSRVRCQEC